MRYLYSESTPTATFSRDVDSETPYTPSQATPKLSQSAVDNINDITGTLKQIFLYHGLQHLFCVYADLLVMVRLSIYRFLCRDCHASRLCLVDRKVDILVIISETDITESLHL